MVLNSSNRCSSSATKSFEDKLKDMDNQGSSISELNDTLEGFYTNISDLFIDVNKIDKDVNVFGVRDSFSNHTISN